MNAPKKSRTLIKDPDSPGNYILQGAKYHLLHFPEKKTYNLSKYSPKACKKEGKR